ncbi:unnamed protein product [Cylicocyclus nassatus]|uniref:Uncharacterized protein n=1 Tax=Cylicocyclus nassatus TaxID=53992 RepID=A0AA36DQ34_CYLNA|nr:unnamed protein product [Cylicocyclus nassatus]
MSGLTRVLSRFSSRRLATSTQDPHAIWKEINRLASEGKWDNLNNQPKMFMFGKAKREAYAAYNAINTKSDIWSSSPYGQIGKGLFRVAAFVLTVQVCVWIYEFAVPEEHRLHYKYRSKHGHGHEEQPHH